MSVTTSPINREVKASILFLTQCLPDDKRKLWLTPKEIRARHVHCGVHSSLTDVMVINALKVVNKGEIFLWKNKFGNTAYYIPKNPPKATQLPNEQRFKAGGRGKRININPERDFFKTCAEAADHLKRVNDALDELAQVETQTQQERTEARDEGTHQPDSGAREDETHETVGERPEDEGTQPPDTSVREDETQEAYAEEEAHVEVEFESGIDMIETQAEEAEPVDQQSLWSGPEIAPLDSYIFMQCNNMDDFIRLATGHSAKCGQQLKLIERNTKEGAAVKEVWICPVCTKRLCFLNTKMVKTRVVDRERKFVFFQNLCRSSRPFEESERCTG